MKTVVGSLEVVEFPAMTDIFSALPQAAPFGMSFSRHAANDLVRKFSGNAQT